MNVVSGVNDVLHVCDNPAFIHLVSQHSNTSSRIVFLLSLFDRITALNEPVLKSLLWSRQEQSVFNIDTYQSFNKV
jgi:hypothetical protein